MKEATKPLTVKLPVSQADHLAELAKKRRVSANVIARQAIRRYLAVEALDRIQDRLAPLAKKLGIKTDEDVYRLLGEEA